MNERASDESDNEGFVPNQIKIDSHNIRQHQVDQSKRKDFQPHYIFSEGFLRKQPIEAIQHYDNIQMKPRTFQYKNPINLNKDELPTVHQLFGNKNKYSSVYSRFKQPFGYGQKKAFQHQLKLNCCQNYTQQHFRTLKQWDQKTIETNNYNESELIFDSRFEGGNLSCAFKSKKQINTYYLFMQNDTNTYGYNQWFYFSIKNAKANTKYTFKIANFKKSYSFFNNGLQPLIFSLTRAKKEGNGWYRGGSYISYFSSNFQELNSCPYYTLQFTVEFDHANDYITISPYPPYSYSKLILALSRQQKIAIKNELSWKLKSICDSICFNQIPYIVLSNRSKGKRHKKKIVVLARQHSGQTWSSFLVEEIMNLLVNQLSVQAKWLLEEFDFHIFPMLNVDGVIYGNFRCDLAGNDLNRCWKNPWENLEPQVYHIKKQIERLSKNDSIAMCLDLHTHSKAYGAFAYACVDSKQCKQLPSLIAKSCSFFRLGACTYGISGDKQFTARAAVFGITQNINILTIELSGYGFRQLNRKYPCPFTPRSIKYIANGILRSYYAYKNNTPLLQNVSQDIQEEQIIQMEMDTGEQNNISTIDFPVQGSDSEPEIDQIQLQVKMHTIFPTKFIQDIKFPKQRKSSKKYKKKQKRVSKEIIAMKIQTKPQIKIRVPATSEIKQSIRSQKSQSLKPINTPQTFHVAQDQLIYQTSAQAKKVINQNQPLYKKKIKITSEQSRKLQNDKHTKPLNLVQFSLKKLPIHPPQKIIASNPPNYHILLDEGPLVIGASYGKKDDNRFDKTFSTYEAMCRPRVRIQSKKIGFARQNSRLEQELPFLCVMSENKKQIQLQRMKQKKQKSFEQKCEGKYIICGHRPQENTIIRFRDKQKQMQLITKIGLDHYARYAENSFVRKT